MVLRQRIRDTLVWCLYPKGSFSVASFRKAWDVDEVRLDGLNKFCWQGIVPPKIELFVWQLIKEKLIVKKILSNFGCIPGLLVVCSVQ